MSQVSVCLAKNTDYQNIRKTIENSIDLIDFKFKKNAVNVLIKPNLNYYYDYSTGYTTDPNFVSAVIDVVRERITSDPNVSIIESDASAMKCKYAFKILGYEKLSVEKGVPLINLSTQKSEKTNVKVLNEEFKFSIPDVIKKADILINIPKIKYMGDVKITCAMKNIFGCNAYEKKYKYHKSLSFAVVGINKLIKTDLVIIDGIIVNGIVTKKLGLVMASEDPVAIDSAAASLLGLNPNSIKFLDVAVKEKLGNKNYVIKGEPLDTIKKIVPKKELNHKLYDFMVKNYMKIFK
jgi:uncharacterized protein (DUF362 family)